MRILLIVWLLTLSALAQSPQLPQSGGYEMYLNFINDRLLGVSNEKEYWLWDVHSRRLLGHEVGTGRALDRATSPDGRYLVITDYPSLARAYSLPEVRRLYTYQAPAPVINGAYEVHFSSDGQSMLLLGSGHGPVQCDASVRQVELASGRTMRSYDFGHKRMNQSSIATGPGMLMARSAGSKLQIWNLRDGKKLREIKTPGNVAWVRGSREGVLCCADQRILYSWSELKRIREVPTDNGDNPNSPDGKLAWTKDDDHLTVTRKADHKVIYQGPSSHSLAQWLTLGFQIYTGQSNNHMNPVYDFDGKKLGALPSILLGASEHRLVTDQPGYGGPVGFYDYQKCRKIGRIPFGTSPQYSPDGKTLAVLTMTGVLLIDVQASLERGKLVPLP